MSVAGVQYSAQALGRHGESQGLGGQGPFAPRQGPLHKADGHRPRRRARWLVVAALLGFLVALGAAIQAGGPLLRDAGVIAAPQRYLALTLPDPTSLPAAAASGDLVTFDFTISSTRTAAVRQEWEVVLTSPGTARQVVARGRALVGPGARVTVPVRFTMPQSASSVTVAITAPGQHLAPLQFHIAPAARGAP